MKGVFIILDGVADLPTQALGQKTPLEYAKTPHLDQIAESSKIDHCYTVKEDYTPESHEAVVSLLGYDPQTADRGSLEAYGLGIKLKNGDLAFRCNFGTIEDLDTLNVLDRRAGRTLTTKEAKILAKAINEQVKLPFKFEFHTSTQHRAVLIFRGGFSSNITKIDSKKEKLQWAKPLDDEDDSKLSAELINTFVRKSYHILTTHPINIARAKKGLYAANVLLCRGAGNKVPKFKKLKGKWLSLGFMPLEIGIAKAAGMSIQKTKVPKLKNIDVYSNIYLGLKRNMKAAIKMLKKNQKKYDYFYIHFKATDIPGHDNKPFDKVKIIEMLDERFFSFLKKFIKENKLIITADHATPCKLKAHSADPVPVLIYPHPKNKKTHNQRFTETQAKEGRKIPGRKLLQENFF